MDKEKIQWCCKQKRGIELVEPKPHLNEFYIKESEYDLGEIGEVGDKRKTIIGYYSCYEAFYSILMKCGIKFEIHDCTIELMNLFDFENEEIGFLKSLKKAREGNQYYLKREGLENDDKLKEFVLKCREISQSLNSEDIENVRNKIEDIKNE